MSTDTTPDAPEFVRPDVAANIAASALDAARHLAASPATVLTVEPGDATRYVFALAIVGGHPGCPDGGLAVTMPGWGAGFVFTLEPHYLHRSYVASKMRLDSDYLAEAVALFVGAVREHLAR